MSYDILCFSYLRWGGVFQRPQHLLSRLARTHRAHLQNPALRCQRIDVAVDVVTADDIEHDVDAAAEE